MNPYGIIVVEDEFIVSMEIGERLAAMGYHLLGSATSGEQAMELIARHRPDLVLMDVRLQGTMDGITAAKEIRGRFQLPVIFLTAYSEHATLEQAKLAEPYGYILKPFDDRELKSAIEIAVHKHRSDQEIFRLNRFYDVLSQVNQSIMRVASRDELLQTVCRILVERGGVNLAWIGLLDPDTSRILPTTHWGGPKDFLTRAVFSADDRPEGQGNPGKAIRENRPFVCNACGNGHCLYPHELAPAKFGFKSWGSFPIHFQGRVCGVLNLGVGDTGFFQEREVELLKEVAMDVSFALDKLEGDARRKQAEEELCRRNRQLRETVVDLEQARNMLQLVIESIPVRVFWKDRDSRYLGCNTLFADDAGLNAPQELLGKDDFAVGWREQAELYRADDRQVMESGLAKMNIIEPQTTPTGARIWLNTSKVPLRLRSGEVVGVLGVYEDITETKRSEELLRESEERYRVLFQGSIQGILAADIETKQLAFANPSFCRMFGYGEEELPRLGLEDIHPKDSQDFILCEFESLLRGEKKISPAVPCLRKDGAVFYADIVASITTLQGRQYAVGFFADVTERIRAEQRIRKVSLVQAALHGPGTLHDKLQRITDGVVDIFDADFARIWLVRPGDLCGEGCMHAGVTQDIHACRHRERCLHLMASSGRYTHLDGEAHRRVPFGCYKIGRVASGDEPSFLTNDVVRDNRVHHHAWAEALGLVSFAGYQLCRPDGEPLGVLALFARHPISTEEDALLKSFSNLIVPVIQASQAEEMARTNEMRLNLALGAAHLGAWEWDLASGKVVWSEAQEALFGYSPGTFPGTVEGFTRCVHPDDLSGLWDAGERAKGADGSFQQEYRVIWPDGTVHWVASHGQYLFDAEGQPVRLVGVVFDISQRKQAENALRESEEKFSLAFQRAPVAAAITVLEDGTYLEVNDRFMELGDFKREEVLGKTSIEIGWLRAEDRQRVIDVLRKNGSVANLEITSYAKDGTPVDCLYFSNPVTIGGARRLLTFVLDITELKRAEKQKTDFESHLRRVQKLEALGTLVGGIAHDFNNILTAIIGYTEMAQTEAIAGSAMGDYLQQVLQAGHRAKDLVKQILTFSRATEGQELRPMKLGLIVKETLKLIRPSLLSTIEIRSNIAPDAGAISGDPSQLHQVLMNLCTNAAHAMGDKGGLLQLGLSNLELDAETARGYGELKAGPYLRLTVRDSGHGMDAATMERIFDPYFSTKGPTEGTGLGLAVVHGIVKGHGGSITVRSKPGEGALFEILLPRIDLISEGTAQTRGDVPGGSERILFVDDEKVLAELGQRMLCNLGYQVAASTSSVEALELFRANPEAFDLVITNYTMPRMTGIRLAIEMQRIRRDIPIILCTGRSEMMALDKATAMHVRALVRKPLSRRDIAEVIRNVLD